MNILVVAAHPDDEVLGCGGTIAKLSRDYPVYIAILGEGSTSREGQRSEADFSHVRDLEENARAAAKLMGAKEVVFQGLPDNRFDELPLLDVVKKIEQLIEDIQPSVIYTHHTGDLNIDHQITFRAVLTAARPVEGGCVRDIYSFEVPSSTEWSFQQVGPPFLPNVFVDITDTVEKKVKAMECYPGEMRPFPHPRSSEALRAIAQRWGSASGLEFAEAFQLVRSVR